MGYVLAVIGLFGFFITLVYIIIRAVKKRFSKKLLFLPLACIVLLFIGFIAIPTSESIAPESIELAISDYQDEYDINTEIPVEVSVLPENAATDDLEYFTDGDSLTFSKSGVVTGTVEGTFNIYVESDGTKSNTLSITVVDMEARESAKEETEAQQKGDDETDTEDLELPEANTSAMVDYLATEAKKSANQAATEEKRDEAINFIYENYPNYYTDNQIMEQVIYYGYYLEYAYNANEGENYYVNLGMDAEQAVKYVYRGTESIEDASTQENLSQIADSLNALGYSVEKQESQSAGSPAETSATTTQSTEEQPQEQMVWIPESGSKYHSKSTCSGMSNPTQVTISEAQSMGYTACKKCY